MARPDGATELVAVGRGLFLGQQQRTDHHARQHALGIERRHFGGHTGTRVIAEGMELLDTERIEKVHRVLGERADRMELRRVKGATEAGQVDRNAMTAVDQLLERAFIPLRATDVLVQKHNRRLFLRATMVIVHLTTRRICVGFLDHQFVSPYGRAYRPVAAGAQLRLFSVRKSMMPRLTPSGSRFGSMSIPLTSMAFACGIAAAVFW